MKYNNNDKYKDYVRELGDLLKEYLYNAQAYCANDPNEFNYGYSSAVKGIIASVLLMKDGFHIDSNELGLDDIDPDKDLIS